ncbi:hypothetical protein [Phaeovulum vinaykumarii]|uniref:Uncharacterized protein n=1 Tax=Phaeovulum vinaykumarii TaxID=407234 RepID=A0A1N7L0U8_9RHOB|nr:hypothetical protein [Phaeovulum vinaykumarii]SIS67465.1 hypothetical protein SAMN05421795_102405 [Phaeovulum vinaykumarii]SOC00706.1 hypothetical protein SAMN05878426_102367 [Phaeovulum vinaykumarii]
MATIFADALSPSSKRLPRPARDIEILRVVANLAGDDFAMAAQAARQAALTWAAGRAGGRFPADAWKHFDFELLAGGRNSAAVRFVAGGVDLWALRAEDPDKTVPGRIWTTEIVIGGRGGDRPHMSLRLIVSTNERELDIEPHVPGILRQIAQNPGFLHGGRGLTDTPRPLRNENDAEDLCDHLEDPARRLPVIVVTLPADAEARPMIDDLIVARAVTGMARVIRVPAELTWVLTQRFGKLRSVFEGGVRLYLPGFSNADDAYRHRLFTAAALQDAAKAEACGSWLRRTVAGLSVSSSRLGKDVVEFAAVRTACRRLRKKSLAEQKAPDAALLPLAEEEIDALKAELENKDQEIDLYIAEIEQAEERATAAEQENRALIWKIRQMQDAQARSGSAQTCEPPLPQEWAEFLDWLDSTYPDRIVLTPQARRLVRAPVFEDVAQVARAIAWLATVQHERRLGGGGSTRDELIETGIYNAYCGGDAYKTLWQGRRYEVDQHVKNGGNLRDPRRCLRIYYFWAPEDQRTVIDHLPTHRPTSAT